MKRRRPAGDPVPPKLRDADAWPGRDEWIQARQDWIAAGNEWPGGEAAEFSEVLAVLSSDPPEPWDGTGY